MIDFLQVTPETNAAHIRATLDALQVIATVIGIFALVGPLGIGWLLWRLSKAFATKEELNGLGGRVTAYETISITNRERADHAHERMDKHEAWLGAEMKYIRRDLDLLLKNQERS